MCTAATLSFCSTRLCGVHYSEEDAVNVFCKARLIAPSPGGKRTALAAGMQQEVAKLSQQTSRLSRQTAAASGALAGEHRNRHNCSTNGVLLYSP
jgi:hypothetical protein